MNTLTPSAAPTGASTHAMPTDRPYVDWGAILAGFIIASAVTVVLTGFGSAIGLSASSPFSGKGLSATVLAIATTLWVIWVAVSSLVAGSYITGRLRRRAGDADGQEVGIRDGAHGLVVWALCAVLGATVATMTVAGVAKTAADLVETTVSSASSMASSVTDYGIDTLLRSETPAPQLDDASRREIGRILVKSASDGELNANDRAYLTRMVAARIGVPPQEVERRLDAYVAQGKALAETARQTAEKARKIGILLAFLTAATLALAAAAAWWGASLGGKHRDENTDFSHFMRW